MLIFQKFEIIRRTFMQKKKEKNLAFLYLS